MQQDSGNKKKKNILKSVVDGMDFIVEEGEVFGLLGHNGAGKTTVLKIITAEESCDAGRVIMKAILIISISLIYWLN